MCCELVATKQQTEIDENCGEVGGSGGSLVQESLTVNTDEEEALVWRVRRCVGGFEIHLLLTLQD